MLDFLFTYDHGDARDDCQEFLSLKLLSRLLREEEEGPPQPPTTMLGLMITRCCCSRGGTLEEFPTLGMLNKFLNGDEVSGREDAAREMPCGTAKMSCQRKKDPPCSLLEGIANHDAAATIPSPSPEVTHCSRVPQLEEAYQPPHHTLGLCTDPTQSAEGSAATLHTAVCRESHTDASSSLPDGSVATNPRRVPPCTVSTAGCAQPAPRYSSTTIRPLPANGKMGLDNGTSRSKVAHTSALSEAANDVAMPNVRVSYVRRYLEQLYLRTPVLLESSSHILRSASGAENTSVKDLTPTRCYRDPTQLPQRPLLSHARVVASQAGEKLCGNRDSPLHANSTKPRSCCARSCSSSSRTCIMAPCTPSVKPSRSSAVRRETRVRRHQDPHSPFQQQQLQPHPTANLVIEGRALAISSRCPPTSLVRHLRRSRAIPR